MKTGALWWRVDGQESDWKNGQAALDWAEAYLHRADGMYFADEEVDGLHTPSRGTETCSVVETMFSMRAVYEVTANITFMDRLETLAFNSLPAALWPDVTSNVYHHANNQIETGAGGPYAYDLYFCCSANVHQGWPKFLFSAVHLQPSEPDTVVVSGYSPSSSTLPDGSTLDIGGTYPFADTATVSLSAGEDAATTAPPKAYNIRLRIPCWSENASVTVETWGWSSSAQVAPPCAFFNASMSTGSKLTVTFVNKIRLYEWSKSTLAGQSLIQGGGIEVHRGALTYALRPASTTLRGNPSGGVQPYPQSLPRGGRADGGWSNITKSQVSLLSCCCRCCRRFHIAAAACQLTVSTIHLPLLPGHDSAQYHMELWNLR